MLRHLKISKENNLFGIKGFERQDCIWKEKFEYLHIFKETYGHVNVPQRFEYNPGLGSWVGKQRGYFFKNKIHKNRINLLETLGFEWAPGKIFSFNASWNKRYQELRYFRALYGHCNVPCKYFLNKELGFWVKNQRQFYKKGIVQNTRIRLLSEVGFEWKRREPFVKLKWNQRFKELEIYIKKYGNSLVPQRSGALGKWVQKQRDQYKKKVLKKDHKNLLDGLNFIWEPRKFNIKLSSLLP